MKLLALTQKLFGLRRRPMTNERAKEILNKLPKETSAAYKQPKWKGDQKLWL